MATILVGSPIGGIAFAAANGELKSFADIIPESKHGILLGIGLAAGWIFFKSPLAPAFQGVLGAARQAEVEEKGSLQDTLPPPK